MVRLVINRPLVGRLTTIGHTFPSSPIISNCTLTRVADIGGGNGRNYSSVRLDHLLT